VRFGRKRGGGEMAAQEGGDGRVRVWRRKIKEVEGAGEGLVVRRRCGGDGSEHESLVLGEDDKEQEIFFSERVRAERGSGPEREGEKAGPLVEDGWAVGEERKGWARVRGHSPRVRGFV
jgi:hypothetical protein